jgi:hypothetical protein
LNDASYRNEFLTVENITSGAGSSSGSTSTQTTETPPTEAPIKSPCDELKDLANNVDFVNKLLGLSSPNVTSLNYEKGFIVTKNSSGGFMYTAVSGASNSQSISYTMNNPTIGFIHTHYDGLSPIPSPDDILTIYNQVMSYVNANAVVTDMASEFSMIVISSNETYTLKMLKRPGHPKLLSPL